MFEVTRVFITHQSVSFQVDKPQFVYYIVSLHLFVTHDLDRKHKLKGKYHCMADLLFILFGFGCFSSVELATALFVWSNKNPSNRRSAVQ